GLETVLRDVFAEATIRDALTNLLITSYDTEHMEPFFFKKRPLRGGWERDLNFYMRDAARASSAAPTYFEPALIGPVGDSLKRFCLIDGGVFANNPAMCAYVEARKIYPRAKRYVLVSLGTGRSNSSFPYDEVRSWGFLEWIRPSNGTPLATIMGSGQSECVDHQLEKLPGVDFYRIEGRLTPGRDEIDDASEENLQRLSRIAEGMIRANSEKLDRICRKLG
ncbi:MAG TPA: patatin-like phospholipase family protein, partial [Spirochaetia bacterium]|nr:patatin-like phospholipase family protein [Spirochaetia bacterium]